MVKPEQTTLPTQTVEQVLPEPYMVLPFVFLLLMIATGPVFYRHFWEKHYPKISLLLALIVFVYYVVILNDFGSIYHSVAEFISFMGILTGLFVITGGILIKIEGTGGPVINSIFLFFGSVISNIIGTTGASMLLIRPFIKLNAERIKPLHIIFFIFLISNIGGALTPIGDPPLFLGFLKGVPFFWVIGKVLFPWLMSLVIITSIFFFIDYIVGKRNNETFLVSFPRVRLKGKLNLFLLLIVLFSVFIDPSIMPFVPSLSPLPFGIREIIMFTAAFIGYQFADEHNLKANEFDFEPIKEVGYLFIGIFITMVPALQLIAFESKLYSEGLTPSMFFWATGILSAFLDNAPTYLNFLSSAMGKFGLDINLRSDVQQFVSVDSIYLTAISIAAVFFGAMTYIGNGPNFMVKSISERAGIRMPSFFVYIVRYSLPVLLPVFTLVWYLFIYQKG